MKLFVSYPNAIGSIVESICRHLPEDAFEPWLDTHQIKAGASISEEIVLNIKDAEYFISFLNDDAIKSDWIRQELEHAVSREQALGRPFIIPILLKGFLEENLPSFLKGDRRFLSYSGSGYPRQIAAFSNELSDELLRLACDRPTLRCEGMAAVYFFSFVEPFVKALWTANSLVLKWESGQKELSGHRPSVRILLPEVLDELHLKDLATRQNLKEGVLLDGEKTIFRKVCFDKKVQEIPDAPMVFYDVPNILNSAATLFAQEFSNREWRKINRMEVLAFKYHLENLADKRFTNARIRAALKVDMLTDAELENGDYFT
jgi:hypothetical protein